MDNFIYIPEVNPVIFYDTARSNSAAYFTKHFEKWMFSERLYEWQRREEYVQVWQTTDIIRLQFESNIGPITVELLNSNDEIVQSLPAIFGLPNQFLPGLFSYEVEMSLAGMLSGCYRMKLKAGTGDETKILISDTMTIFDGQIPNTVLLEYWDTKPFHKDVIWKTNIKMQIRLFGHLGFLDKPRKDEFYHDDKNNPVLLNSKSTKQYPFIVGDEFGLPDDIYNIVDEIWGLNNVLIDGKPFGIADNSKVEEITIDENAEYPKRGFKYTVEEGINRNSRIFALEANTTQKILANLIVDAKVFGDLANQGSSNAVPIQNIE